MLQTCMSVTGMQGLQKFCHCMGEGEGLFIRRLCECAQSGVTPCTVGSGGVRSVMKCWVVVVVMVVGRSWLNVRAYVRACVHSCMRAFVHACISMRA